MARDVFTIVADIEPGSRGRLDEVLEALDADLAQNPYLRLSPEACPEVHFASFVVFDVDEGMPPVLVFENCVDAPIDRYLHQLASLDGIDAIFGCCTGYPRQPTHSSRFAYLRARVRRPDLYHLGAPYRTAARIREDVRVRRSLDEALDGTVASLLDRQIATPPAGIREYWRWELAVPWVAGLLAAATLWFEILLAETLDLRGRPWWSALALAGGGVAAFGFLAARRLWAGAVPEVRDRARSWVAIVLGATTLGAVARIWPDLATPLRSTGRWPVLAGLAVLGSMLVLGIAAAVGRRRSERIAAIRAAAGEASAIPLWRALRAISGPYRLERPPWIRRLWNWKLWLGSAAAIVGAGVWWEGARGAAASLAVATGVFTAGLVGAFAVKACWLAALTGWPSADWKGRPHIRGLPFVIAGTAAGALLVGLLVGLEAHAALLGGAALVGLFVLWSFTIPSEAATEPPPVSRSPRDAARLRAVLDQEDEGVQNHMSLVAVVRPRWRRLALRLFLRLLNGAFYRALLPDAWRGKLFGLPTVHCAQWVLLPDGRFLFLSNYDHSWSTYLDDFGAHLGGGIQKIWGQCHGNPGTADLARFKRFVRAAMVPYRVWYRGYPDLTVRQIWNTEQLRAALARDLPEEQLLAALRRLGAAPTSLPEIVHAAQ